MFKYFIVVSTLFALQVRAEEIPVPAPTTTAAPETPSVQREAVVNQRQENQDNRIDQGVQSGALTEKEANRMEKREQHIQKMENKAMADGKMSGKEFRKIERAQNRTSKSIHRSKHNNRHR